MKRATFNYPFHLRFQIDLIALEYKKVATKVKKNQPGKKNGKDLAYHLSLQEIILWCANV